MSKIITGDAVNNYLLTKGKVDREAVAEKQKGVAERRALELEIVTDPVEAEFRIKDRQLCSRIGLELVSIYPGHGWNVESDIQNGIVKIFNAHMNPNYGYLWKTKDILLNTLSKDIMRIGGEILERYGLNRNRFDADQIRQIQHNTHGNVRPDLT